MPKATPINKTSVGLGQGGPWKGPDFPAVPTTGMPDRVDLDNQHNKEQELKAGVKPPTQRNWNPGK